MNELEWLEGNNTFSMLQFATDRATSRVLRLVGCALCRSLPKFLMADRHCITAIETIERYADGSATPSEIGATSHMLGFWNQEIDLTEALSGLRQGAIAAVSSLCLVEDEGRQLSLDFFNSSTYSELCYPFGREYSARSPSVFVLEVLRDIFGNPFRPVTVDPEWRTSTAVALAAQMYESRDFSAMPILADALQDAGCEDTDVLDHCRGAGPHVRGCWVVDRVLGKS